MRDLRSIARTTYRAAVIARVRSRVAALRARRTLPAPLIGALTDSLRANASPAERRWLNAIAGLRAELQSCKEPIEVVDYGAGSPDEKRSDEQMKAGIRVRSTVAACAAACKDDFWGAFLFSLLRHYRPIRCLELGTNLGISAAYQAAALKLNGDGSIVTLEGAPALAARARANAASLGLQNVTVIEGRFADTLAPVCAAHGPFDYVFIDGHHDERATERYFEAVLPFSQTCAIFVFDDIEWSSGMSKAWKTIRTHPRVRASVDLSQLGICILA